MNFLFTKDTLAHIAQQVWEQGKAYPVWAFHAPMGAGKTTFINTLCAGALGITDAVSSPTFAIINEYKSPVTGIVYHMDWYRLKGEEEALGAGVEDCLLSGNLCLVEWPNIAPALLPDNTLHITIEVVDEATRLLSLL